jgi:hypothetical protein
LRKPSGCPSTTCKPGPIYHRRHDSIEAHLTIVFAALAVSRWTEQATGWSIRKFVRTARRYRTIEIQAAPHTITAADPSPATCAKPSTASTAVQVRTNVSQVRFQDLAAQAGAGRGLADQDGHFGG